MVVNIPVEAEDAVEIFIRDLDPVIDWAAIFGNTNPVEIEIGSGKGRFILRSAAMNPGIDYLGIERSLHYFRQTRERVLEHGLSNVRLLRDDAVYLVEKFVPDASISAYHVYFPDPWPKTRHRKRRLFNADFMEQFDRTLTPGGTIDLATDHEAYFRQIAALFDRRPGFRKMDGAPKRVAALGTGVTNFEVKYLASGRAIYRAAYLKIES